jgi:hypothetical protein
MTEAATTTATTQADDGTQYCTMPTGMFSALFSTPDMFSKADVCAKGFPLESVTTTCGRTRGFTAKEETVSSVCGTTATGATGATGAAGGTATGAAGGTATGAAGGTATGAAPFLACDRDMYRMFYEDGTSKCTAVSVECGKGFYEVMRPTWKSDRRCATTEAPTGTYTYRTCYKNDGPQRASRGYDGHIKVLDKDECETLARHHGATYFGLENGKPGTGGASAKADCLLFTKPAMLSTIGNVDLLESTDCASKATLDGDGNNLGGLNLLAVYKLSNAEDAKTAA